MARLSVDYFSDVLEMAMSMTVLLPEPVSEQIGATGAAPPTTGTPVLYLLHGLSDDHTSWTRRSSLERHVEASGLAVVMPNGHRSFYADEQHGPRHWTHLTEELPERVASFFSVSSRREDTFVAGLSMGGYGAMKWALRQPWRFSAAASLSGALDVAALDDQEWRRPLLRRVYGEAGPGPDDDLFSLLRAADAARLPRLHLSCGAEDPLLDATRRFAAAARERGLDPVLRVAPGGHEWPVWDRDIHDVLAWLPLPSRAPAPGP
jgi:S-formylglutathione hydrolase FrmB